MLLQSKTCRLICVMFHSYVILFTLLIEADLNARKYLLARLQKEKGGVVYVARQDTVIATCCNSHTFPFLPLLKVPGRKPCKLYRILITINIVLPS